MRNKIIFGTLVAAAASGCSSENPDLTLRSEGLNQVNEVSPYYQSYNIEMAELVGGRFWKPYKDIKKPLGVNSYGIDVTDSSSDIYQEMPPVDLSDERILKLARGLSPAYVRVSGTWANATWFQGEETMPDDVPDGFVNILTAQQWKGLLDFVKATDSKLMTSFCVSDGVRDKNGLWTPVEADKIISFSEKNGVKIAAAELFNEPNIPTAGGEFSNKRYDAEDYAKDIAIFDEWAANRAPYMLRVGPGTFGDGLECLDAFKDSQPEMKELMLDLDDMMSSSPRPQFDVFSYHFYGGVSKRIMPGPPVGIFEQEALGSEWLNRTDVAFEHIRRIRDKYTPGLPIWLTETAEAAGGGDPWANTYTDTFRYLYQLGSLAQRGLNLHMHNTLLTSEYSLVDHHTLEPNPNYWAALLWNRLMGTKVYDVSSDIEGFYIFAHNRKDKDGITYLLINTGSTEVTVGTGAMAEQYLLTADSLDSREVMLNGKTLALTDDHNLPVTDGEKVKNGKLSIPPKGIAFVTIPMTV